MKKKCKKHTKKSRSKLSKGVKNCIVAIVAMCLSIVGGSIDVLIQLNVEPNVQPIDLSKRGNEEKMFLDIEGLEKLIKYNDTRNLSVKALEYILENNMY